VAAAGAAAQLPPGGLGNHSAQVYLDGLGHEVPRGVEVGCGAGADCSAALAQVALMAGALGGGGGGGGGSGGGGGGGGAVVVGTAVQQRSNASEAAYALAPGAIPGGVPTLGLLVSAWSFGSGQAYCAFFFAPPPCL
jgi:hypothetical protein